MKTQRFLAVCLIALLVAACTPARTATPVPTTGATTAATTEATAEVTVEATVEATTEATEAATEVATETEAATEAASDATVEVASAATAEPTVQPTNTSPVYPTRRPRATGEADATADATDAASTDATSEAAATGDELIVGFVLVGPKTDKGWSEAHFRGAEYMQGKVPGVTIKVVEALDPNITLEQIVENLKSEGAKLIFTTSDFFQEDTTRLAEANPDITFINISGDAVLKGTAPDNLGNVMGRMEYTKMIAGCAAALTTQKNHIAYLGPLINDETRRLVVSTYLGARHCFETYRQGDPKDLKFEVKWIGFWFNQPGVTLDPVEVTNGFYDAGADVVISGIDTTEAITIAKQRADKGEKVWALPYDYRDACSLGESACLGVPFFNWGPTYTKIVSDVKAGTWKSSWDWLGPDWTDMNNPDTSAVGFIVGSAFPADKKGDLDYFIAELSSGDLNLFKGPMNYQSGKEYLKEGEVATDNQVWYMPELVEGIEGESK